MIPDEQVFQLSQAEATEIGKLLAGFAGMEVDLEKVRRYYDIANALTNGSNIILKVKE